MMFSSLYNIFFIISLFFLSVNAGALENAENNLSFEEKIKTYLMNHPEVITEALQKQINNEQEKQFSMINDKIKENYSKISNLDNSFFIGDKNSKKIVVEFLDYTCVYCKKLNVEIKQLEQEKDIVVIFKNMPILSELSREVAATMLAANKLDKDKAVKLHHLLLENNFQDKTELVKFVTTAGFEIEKIIKLSQEKWVETEINTNIALGQDIGLMGVPSMIIGDQIWNGASGPATATKIKEALLLKN